MAIKESHLTAITSAEMSGEDYVRVVTSGGSSRIAKISELAEALIDESVLTAFASDGWTPPEA